MPQQLFSVVSLAPAAVLCCVSCPSGCSLWCLLPQWLFSAVSLAPAAVHGGSFLGSDGFILVMASCFSPTELYQLTFILIPHLLAGASLRSFSLYGDMSFPPPSLCARGLLLPLCMYTMCWPCFSSLALLLIGHSSVLDGSLASSLEPTVGWCMSLERGCHRVDGVELFLDLASCF